MSIRSEIEREVRQLRSVSCQLPPSVDQMMTAGDSVLCLDDETLTNEWELYGKLPALMFMAAWGSGLTPKELNIKSF